jgi:hypothetical protein
VLGDVVGVEAQSWALAVADADRAELSGVLVDPAASYAPPLGYLGGRQ